MPFARTTEQTNSDTNRGSSGDDPVGRHLIACKELDGQIAVSVQCGEASHLGDDGEPGSFVLSADVHQFRKGRNVQASTDGPPTTRFTENPDGTVDVRLSAEELDLVDRITEERRTIPVSEVVEIDRGVDPDGHLIVSYEHHREYPTHLVFPGVVPTQTLEERGWPCPRCGSCDTSAWGETTVADHRSFECNGCGADGDLVRR